MKKLSWGMLVLISFVISILIHFNEAPLELFVFYSVFSFCLIFSLVYSSIKLFENRGGKKKSRYVALIFFLIIVSLLYLLFFLSSRGLCLTAITPNHFRTNVITGRCDFGGYSPCVSSNPWYYRTGCDLSNEELIQILKKSGEYDHEKSECQWFCDMSISELFCTEEQPIWSGNRANKISCDYLVDCEKIICD